MISTGKFLGRPAHMRSQFKPPEPPKQSPIPEIPPNYQNEIAQAREYTQQPYDHEPIPVLIGRLGKVYAVKAWEGYQEGGRRVNNAPGLKQLNTSSLLVKILASIVVFIIGSTTTRFLLNAIADYEQQQTRPIQPTAPINPN